MTTKGYPMQKNKRWTGYYDAVDRQPPRDTLLIALDHWETTLNNEAPHNTPSLAIDLGCGSGRDTYELLRRGWRVLAIDQEAEAIQRLRRGLPTAIRANRSADTCDRLTTQVAPFAELALPPSQLINASFSLPFCEREYFDDLWQAIVDSLPTGGLFAGHIFGDRDSWVTMGGMTFHSRSQFDARFAGFEMVDFNEVDEDGSTATGREKHWHYFGVVARKR